jgi:hypothetical protein
MTETLMSSSQVLLFGRKLEDLVIQPPGGDPTHNPFVGARGGNNKLVEMQLPNANIARIYGFSYEGTYHDLPRPTLFLVHGDGEEAETVADPRGGGGGGNPVAAKRTARSPDDPSRTGLAVAEFSFADGLRVWSYDKADYTIRMDVETGMFEQVLFDLVAGDGGGNVSGAMVRGAMVRGAMVRGAMVRGAMVRGAMVRGAMVRGGRGDATD